MRLCTRSKSVRDFRSQLSYGQTFARSKNVAKNQQYADKSYCTRKRLFISSLFLQVFRRKCRNDTVRISKSSTRKDKITVFALKKSIQTNIFSGGNRSMQILSRRYFFTTYYSIAIFGFIETFASPTIELFTIKYAFLPSFCLNTPISN